MHSKSCDFSVVVVAKLKYNNPDQYSFLCKPHTPLSYSFGGH